MKKIIVCLFLSQFIVISFAQTCYAPQIAEKLLSTNKQSIKSAMQSNGFHSIQTETKSVTVAGGKVLTVVSGIYEDMTTRCDVYYDKGKLLPDAVSFSNLEYLCREEYESVYEQAGYTNVKTTIKPALQNKEKMDREIFTWEKTLNDKVLVCLSELAHIPGGYTDRIDLGAYFYSTTNNNQSSQKLQEQEKYNDWEKNGAPVLTEADVMQMPVIYAKGVNNFNDGMNNVDFLFFYNDFIPTTQGKYENEIIKDLRFNVIVNPDKTVQLLDSGNIDGMDYYFSNLELMATTPAVYEFKELGKKMNVPVQMQVVIQFRAICNKFDFGSINFVYDKKTDVWYTHQNKYEHYLNFHENPTLTNVKWKSDETKEIEDDASRQLQYLIGLQEWSKTSKKRHILFSEYTIEVYTNIQNGDDFKITNKCCIRDSYEKKGEKEKGNIIEQSVGVEHRDDRIATQAEYVTSGPVFPGGSKTYEQWVRWAEKEYIRLPEELIGYIGGRGEVKASYIIEKDGRISDVKIEYGVHPLLDDKVIQLIKKMPRLIPARAKGTPVRYKMIFPYTFRFY